MLASAAMDAAEALADLVEISSQVDAAAILDETGELAAAVPARERGAVLARAGRNLLTAAADVGSVSVDRSVTRFRAATRTGSLFVVREGGRTIVAATGPTPTVGLVFYDLRTALGALGEPATGADAAESGAGA